MRKRLIQLVYLFWIPSYIFGQTPFKNVLPPNSASHITMMAIVRRVDSGVIHASSEGKSILLKIGVGAVIWKGRNFHDLSPVYPGDEILVTGQVDPSGNVAVSRIWDNAVHLIGTILSINGSSELKIKTVPSGIQQERERIIKLDQETQFSDSDRTDLKVGRRIDIVGVKLDKTRVEASRIIVYIENRPAQMPAKTPVAQPKRKN